MMEPKSWRKRFIDRCEKILAAIAMCHQFEMGGKTAIITDDGGVFVLTVFDLD